MTFWSWIERFEQDLRFAARLFRKNPGFSLTALLMLGLGIGANTAVFSAIQAVLLRPLPYKEPDRLVAIWDQAANAKGVSKLFATYSDLLAYKANSRTLEEVSGLTWAVGGQTMSGRGPSRDVLAIPVTDNFFRLAGVQPELGRTFGAEDAIRACTVLLSHSFWSRTLGGDRSIIGQTLRLNGQACTVAGVMPASFAFYPEQAALWTVIARNSPLTAKPDTLGIGIFARLRSGVSIAAAQQELTALHQRTHSNDRHGSETRASIYPLKGEFTWLASRTLTLSLMVLFAAVSFVLLIACVNTANLLLGRSLARRREIGIRVALGSGRARLIRQLLTESMLLSLAAAVIGTAFAWAAVRWFRLTGPVQMPPGTRIEIDGAVLALAAGLSIATVLIFGLIPAWRTSRADLTEVLKA
jgi:predicted permease